MSDSPLQRFRLERRLRRAGLDAPRAVDPWRAEVEMRDGDWDAVLWASTMHGDMARAYVRLQPVPRETPIVLVVDDGTSTAEVAAALDAGIADVVRAGADQVEMAARTAALARRRVRQRVLLEEARRIHELADGSRDLLARHSPDGLLLYASAAARDILGVEPGDLIGRRVADLAHPDERDRTERAVRGDGEGADGSGLHAHRLRRRDGGWVWVETSVRSVRDPGGRIREVHTDSRDVTDRVRAEADRSSLARITAAVAGGADLPQVAALVAVQAAVVAGVDGGAVVRRHGDEGLVVGAAGPSLRVGDVLSLPLEAPATARAPVTIGETPWGVVLARGVPAFPPAPDAPRRLQPLADLVSLSVAKARAHERLLALATTDPLTSLSNRRSFRDRLEAECARSVRGGIPLGLALVNLDHFKRVNDTYGHQVGDAVLCETARRLRRCARREDVVARVGGEEFAWILPEAALDAALEAAERLRRRIAEAAFPVVGRVTASIGVAVLGAGGPDDLYRDADRALYRAKDAGRDRCEGWTPADALMEARSG